MDQEKRGFTLPGGRVGQTLICLAVTALAGFVYFYLALPAINFQDGEFYTFLVFLCVVYIVCVAVTTARERAREVRTPHQKVRDGILFVKKNCLPVGILLALVLAAAFVGKVISLPIFRASAYRELLDVQTGDFAQEVTQISFSEIPTLDRTSANYLGDRQMGTLSDMVSQFEYSNDSTQINYQGRPVRVAPIGYADLFKWITNRKGGLPAYVVVDMVTQQAQVVRLGEGMKYSFSEPLNRNVMRHLRFQYPTMMFSTPEFEIDEDGHPWWIAPRLVKTIGLFGGRDIQGAVLLDAVTGDSQYYEEVPTWVDTLYTPQLIMEQYDYHGTLVHGFINSILGQRDVTMTTDGYNYIAMNDDVYVYTGVTSHRGRGPGLRRGRCPGPGVCVHVPAAAEHLRPAHLFHPPDGRHQPGEELRHGERGPVPDRGHRRDRARLREDLYLHAVRAGRGPWRRPARDPGGGQRTGGGDPLRRAGGHQLVLYPPGGGEGVLRPVRRPGSERDRAERGRRGDRVPRPAGGGGGPRHPGGLRGECEIMKKAPCRDPAGRFIA